MDNEKLLEEDIEAHILKRREELDRGNREEFVRRNGDLESSCARTSISEIDRASHMKTAVIDNQDRFLTRSIASEVPESKIFVAAEERIKNLETHLGIITAPCDKDLYTRIKAVEDKILKIEQHYPQIAAHCFNYGRAEKVASTRPGGRVSKIDLNKRPVAKKLSGIEADSVQELHEKMVKLREKLVKIKK